MIDALKFVSMAVAKKDYVPDLSHFRIRHGKIMSTNGNMTICSPIDIDIDVFPHAGKFTKAIKACEESIKLNVTKAEKLAIRSGKMRSYIPCLPEDAVRSEAFSMPVGNIFELGDNIKQFMAGLKVVSKFMGKDASRMWALGLCLDNQFMYATNNVMAVQYWHGISLPGSIIIPAEAIIAVLASKVPLECIQTDGNSLTFHFGKDLWVKTQLVAETYPDQGKTMFDDFALSAVPTAINSEFYDLLANIKPFLGERGLVYFKKECIATEIEDGDGTRYDIEILGAQDQAFHHEYLNLLDGVAKTWDITTFPKPCTFQGTNLRGVILGVKVHASE